MSSQRDDKAMPQSGAEETRQAQSTRRVRIGGPVAVGLFFAVIAILLGLIGLWREDNLTLRNTALAIALGGGTWGLISWAIATAVMDVDKDVASRRDRDG
jgi:hypothetical protein